MPSGIASPTAIGAMFTTMIVMATMYNEFVLCIVASQTGSDLYNKQCGVLVHQKSKELPMWKILEGSGCVNTLVVEWYKKSFLNKK